MIYLIAHNIRSLHNIGAFFRTADCFGVDKIFLTGYSTGPAKSSDPTDIMDENGGVCRQKKQISKTALGADDWIPWEKTRDIKNVIEKLEKEGVNIYALETGEGTEDITDYKIKFPCALIVGNEIEGISQDVLNMADKVLSIPMQGKKESLNVSVATGVALYELQKQKSGSPGQTADENNFKTV